MLMVLQIIFLNMHRDQRLIKLLLLKSMIFFSAEAASQTTLEIEYIRENLPYVDSLGNHEMSKAEFKPRMLMNDSFALVYYFSNSFNRRVKGKKIGHKLMHHGTFYDFINDERLFEIRHTKNEKYLVIDTSTFCNWVFYDEEKIILNKKCRMALSVNYNNDSTLLWFTQDLPFKNGPLFYRCIPGVVMEVFDQTRNMHFLAATIREKQIQLVYPEKAVKLSYSEWVKIRDARKPSH